MNSLAQDAADPEKRIARAVRLLGVSGRRLMLRAGIWCVMPKGDARMRPIFQLGVDDVERLREEGRIVAVAGGYVLAPERRQDSGRDALTPPWVFAAAGVAASRGKGLTFMSLALQARMGKGPLSLRGTAAGLKLVADTEQAGRDGALTMNWDATPAARQPRSGGSGGRRPAALDAAARVARIRTALGEETFAFLFAACMRQERLRALERRHGMRRCQGARVLADALEKLAAAYDR